MKCANQQCAKPVGREPVNGRTNLCKHCRYTLIRNLVPTTGFIPSDALSVITVEILADLKPIPGERKEAIQMMRGPRHRQGKWEDRPAYSSAVVFAYSPRPPMARRLPHILVGRRFGPNLRSIIAAAVHYHLALSVLGVGKRPALYLAGASYFARRSLKRPDGTTREYQERCVKNAYRLQFSEFAALGRLALRASTLLGLDGQRHPAWITTQYVSGIASGRFHEPVVVHPASGVTSCSGDHPLDHFLARHDYAPNLPRFKSKIRRASGKIAGVEDYPEGLDASLEDIQQRLKNQRQAQAAVFKVNTTTAQPSTEWLFG